MGIYLGQQAISFYSGTGQNLSAELTEQREIIQELKELVNSKAAPVVTGAYVWTKQGMTEEVIEDATSASYILTTANSARPSSEIEYSASAPVYNAEKKTWEMADSTIETIVNTDTNVPSATNVYVRLTSNPNIWYYVTSFTAGTLNADGTCTKSMAYSTSYIAGINSTVEYVTDDNSAKYPNGGWQGDMYYTKYTGNVWKGTCTFEQTSQSVSDVGVAALAFMAINDDFLNSHTNFEAYGFHLILDDFPFIGIGVGDDCPIFIYLNGNKIPANGVLHIIIKDSTTGYCEAEITIPISLNMFDNTATGYDLTGVYPGNGTYLNVPNNMTMPCYLFNEFYYYGYDIDYAIDYPAGVCVIDGSPESNFLYYYVDSGFACEWMLELF